ncbi:MAG TPA: Gldg family protein [Allosphingosinicella sp.]
MALAAAALAAVLLALSAYRAEDAPRTSSLSKPNVLLMTALPLVWGEGGAFDPNSRPAPFYTALQAEFAFQPIDALDAESLGEAKLLLLIQPRWLAPEELVALDGWVRRGGNALILTDPKLNWHSDLPLGDIRRPPPVGLLQPLLSHWGLAMEPGDAGALRIDLPGGRTLAVEDPGRLTATSTACKVVLRVRANCRIGRGRAILLADVDLVREELWQGEGRADNPRVVADLLGTLAGLTR